MLVKELCVLSCLRRRVPFILFDSLVNGLNLALRWWCTYFHLDSIYVTEADEKLRPEFGTARYSHNNRESFHLQVRILNHLCHTSPATCFFHFFSKHKIHIVFLVHRGWSPCKLGIQSKHFIMMEAQCGEVPIPYSLLRRCHVRAWRFNGFVLKPRCQCPEV